MGNCLKRSTNDDISLLRGSNETDRESSDQLGPPPIYSVRMANYPVVSNRFGILCFSHVHQIINKMAFVVLFIKLDELG